MIHKGQTQADIDAEKLEAERAEIRAELDRLEVYVPRIVEDMIPLVPCFEISDAKAAIIASKVELRSRLMELNK